MGLQRTGCWQGILTSSCKGATSRPTPRAATRNARILGPRFRLEAHSPRVVSISERPLRTPMPATRSKLKSSCTSFRPRSRARRLMSAATFRAAQWQAFRPSPGLQRGIMVGPTERWTTMGLQRTGCWQGILTSSCKGATNRPTPRAATRNARILGHDFVWRHHSPRGRCQSRSDRYGPRCRRHDQN